MHVTLETCLRNPTPQCAHLGQCYSSTSFHHYLLLDGILPGVHSGTRVGDLHLQVEAHDHVQDEEEVDLPPAKAEDPKSGCFRASGIVSKI